MKDKTRRHGKCKYYWDEWFAEKEVALIYKRDFDCDFVTFRQQVRNEANKRRLSTRIRMTPIGMEVSVMGTIQDPDKPS